VGAFGRQPTRVQVHVIDRQQNVMTEISLFLCIRLMATVEYQLNLRRYPLTGIIIKQPRRKLSKQHTAKAPGAQRRRLLFSMASVHHIHAAAAPYGKSAHPGWRSKRTPPDSISLV